MLLNRTNFSATVYRDQLQENMSSIQVSSIKYLTTIMNMLNRDINKFSHIHECLNIILKLNSD